VRVNQPCLDHAVEHMANFFTSCSRETKPAVALATSNDPSRSDSSGGLKNCGLVGELAFVPSVDACGADDQGEGSETVGPVAPDPSLLFRRAGVDRAREG
jgi:hypothetical protein